MQFGDHQLGDITPDEVDAAVMRLAERGRLKPIRNGTTTQANQPLSGATLDRYISQLDIGVVQEALAKQSAALKAGDGQVVDGVIASIASSGN